MTTTSAFDSTLASLGIGRSSAAANATSALKYDANGNQVLGQSDFLKLMTAQMQNQDPFNPVDNTQMVAQMAQFSSLSGISDMNTTLKSIAAKLTGTSTSDAMAYVGKTVLTEGSSAYARTTGGLAGAVELDSDATDLSVAIKDANGATLKTLDLGAQKTGTASFDWDGTTDAGTPAGAGPFTVSALAHNGAASVTSRTLVWAPVTSVSLSGASPVLSVAGIGDISPTAVRQVG